MALHLMPPPSWRRMSSRFTSQLGHTHPEGVLQYSAIESVVLFHTADELQIMVCGVMKALTLHDKVIKVRTSPPSAAHVRAYVAVVNGEPSGIQTLPSD